MNIYRIWQDVNNDYDTYSDAIVAADSEDEARRIHPRNEKDATFARTVAADGNWKTSHGGRDVTWANIKDVRVEHVGVALPTIERGVLCASFHAG